MLEKIKSKLANVRSVDPLMLVAVGAVAFIFSNLVPYVAVAAIAYVAYKIFIVER